MDYKIEHDYDAIRNAGSVRKAAKRRIVLHSMESTNQTGAAEGTGSWFANRACQGSTQYGVDENSIQQYLPDLAIPWGAAHLNTDGIHIEQMGTARWSKAQWLSKAPGTLKRTAWLMARLSKRYDIPLEYVKGDALRTSRRGVTTHEWSTEEWGIYGGHTDPGHGYPYAEVLTMAKAFAGEERINIVLLKQRMDAYQARLKLKVVVPPDYSPDSPSWGPGAQTYAWRLSKRLVDTGKLAKQTYRPSKALWEALQP